MFTSETLLTVRYVETDQMGIVHHSNYAIWFEAGRTDFIKKMGLPYSKVEKMGLILPLVELKCTFKGFARYEDEIVVKTSIKEYTAIRLVFQYKVYKNGCHDAITCGETMHAWTTPQLKPINIKKHFPQVFNLVEKATEDFI